jgi:hypothetical protein
MLEASSSNIVIELKYLFFGLVFLNVNLAEVAIWNFMNE